MLNQLNARLNEIHDIANKDILVVVGMAKSGTTWVQRMLNTHPEIYCPGEGKFRRLIHGFLKAVTAYNKELDYTNRVVYREGAYYRTWDDAATTTAIQFMIALSWANSEHKDLTRVRYIGDKDTEYHTSESIRVWRDHLFRDARFVHVIRDGRDSAISLMHHKRRTMGMHIDPNSLEFDKFLRDHATEWADNIRRMRTTFRDLPHLYHEVRYEDLLQQPRERLEAILTFLGVDTSPNVVQHILTENTFRKLSGGREAGQEDRDSFYRKGTSGEWEDVLGPRAGQIFTDTSGDLLEELGYKT